jgi:hypothetical protein
MKVPVCVCQTDLIYVGYYYHITFLVTRLTRRVPLVEHELLPFRSTWIKSVWQTQTGTFIGILKKKIPIKIRLKIKFSILGTGLILTPWYLVIGHTHKLSSSLVFSGIRITWSLVLCVCYVDRCLSFCTFSFGHCVVCSSSIYGTWLLLC